MGCQPILAEVAPGWRVMAQVSLGAVLDADSVAFDTINAKRVDFLIVDRTCARAARSNTRPVLSLVEGGRATTRAPPPPATR